VRSIIPRSPARRPLALAVAALGGALACADAPPRPPVAAPAPAATAAPAAARVVVLGDSLAAGLGLDEAQAFPAVAQELLRAAGHSVDVHNAGVSGDTSAGGLARLDWVLRQRPHVLVVELGGNDALRGQPLESIERNLREIVRRGRAAGARVVLLGMDIPTNYGPAYADGFAALYERIARDEGVDLVPGFVRAVGADPALLQPDGLHPTAEGQRRLAAKLVPSLAALLVGGPTLRSERAVARARAEG
jgi:acyl-CoA thioesterase-1